MNIPCRVCGGVTVSALNLGHMPLANSLMDSPIDSIRRYPTELLICRECDLGQLRDFVPPDRMFKEYLYYTSISSPSVILAGQLVDRVITSPGDLVIEIGSNDGYLLGFYKQRGVNVLGIDPAKGPANLAAMRGIPTIQDFFTQELAESLPRKANIIHANNVLAHVPDLNDFVAGVAIALKPGGSCYVEVPNLDRLLAACEFDTIYHEHSYYFSLLALQKLFWRHELFVQEIEYLDAHGQSLRVRFGDFPSLVGATPMYAPRDLSTLQDGVNIISTMLYQYLVNLKASGKRVWGFGAAAKATIMMNYCGITSDLIEAVADDTPAKLGKYIPGTGIQIKSSKEWLESQPDYTCIFAWNYEEEIRERYGELKDGLIFAPQIYKGTFFTPYKLT